MRATWTPRLARLAAIAALVISAGCSNLLGLRDAVDDGDCVLNSDCAPDKACIFRVCSPRCQADKDCSSGQRCLRTNDGVACVDSMGAGCNRTCPLGTTCDTSQNVCRNGCTSNTECLGGQVCTSGVCRGSDTGRDPVIDAGARDASVDNSTGSGGSGGTSGAGGTAGAAATGGNAGTGGRAGSGGSSGTGGNAGAAGTGTGGAIGTGGAAGTGAGGAVGTGGAAGTGAGAAGTGGTGGAPDAAIDANADACAHECNLGDTRCGIAQGLQSCVAGGDGCRVWAPETPCGGRRICTDHTASCACAPAPLGCENGAGKFCSDGTTLVECAADGDGCIYKLSPVTCPAGKPCTGTHPSASCSCSAAPTACMNQQGTFCESAMVVATCGLTDGCLAITNRVTCPGGKPCTGNFGAASCSCAAPPADCAAGAGHSCRGAPPGELVECGTNSEGCLAVTNVTSCPAGKPCAGTPPGSLCTCPTPPPGCNQAGTTFCQSSTTVATCDLDANSCLNVAGTTTCPTGKPCVNGACTCPQPPAICGGQAGVYCGANNNIVACAVDPTSGCLGVSSNVSCGAGKQCTGGGGSASCTCLPPPPDCAGGAGRVCRPGNVLATCGADPTTGCIVTTGTAMCSPTKPCSGSHPNADCTCPAPPGGCSDPTKQNGSYCINNTSFGTCSTSSEGCVTGNITTCTAGQFCQQAYPASSCAPPLSLGFASDLGSSQSHGAGALSGFAVTTTNAVTLHRFGLIPKNVSGQHVRFALYEAIGGVPRVLVAQSGELTLSAGQQIAPTMGGIALKASTTYFIMAIFDAATDVGHDTTGATTLHYIFRAYGAVFPGMLNDGGTGTATTPAPSQSNMNFYILVY